MFYPAYIHSDSDGSAPAAISKELDFNVREA